MNDMDVVGGRPGSSRAAFQRSQIGKGGGECQRTKLHEQAGRQGCRGHVTVPA